MMKIYNTHVIKFVTIDTNVGDFRVSSNGKVEVWNDGILDYITCYDWDYDEEIISELLQIAEGLALRYGVE